MMPSEYYRIDLRISPEWSAELEKLKREVYEKSGKKVSKSELIREMMKVFLEKPSSSCNSKKEET